MNDPLQQEDSKCHRVKAMQEMEDPSIIDVSQITHERKNRHVLRSHSSSNVKAVSQNETDIKSVLSHYRNELEQSPVCALTSQGSAKLIVLSTTYPIEQTLQAFKLLKEEGCCNTYQYIAKGENEHIQRDTILAAV